MYVYYFFGFLGGSVVKNLPVTQEPRVRSLGWEDPLEQEMQPTPGFLPEKSHRSLEGYSPWGHKELDMTKWLNNSNNYFSGLDFDWYLDLATGSAEPDNN